MIIRKPDHPFLITYFGHHWQTHGTPVGQYIVRRTHGLAPLLLMQYVQDALLKGFEGFLAFLLLLLLLLLQLLFLVSCVSVSPSCIARDSSLAPSGCSGPALPGCFDLASSGCSVLALVGCSSPAPVSLPSSSVPPPAVDAPIRTT